jgi:plastocyanin
MLIRPWILCAAAVAALGLGACSGSGEPSLAGEHGPTTWHLQAGAADSTQAFQGLAFYPASITIDAGDSIEWTFPAGEPHTVSLLGAGQATPPPATDPNVANPAGGNTYDGSTYVSSGFKLLGGTYRLRFPKPGTYTVYCLIHQPEMQLVINVAPATSLYPSTQAQLTSTGSSSAAADIAAAKQSTALFPYAGTADQLAAGIAPGGATGAPSTSTVMRFLDSSDATNVTETVPLGTTVTWTNLSNNAPHTVTFGIAGQPFPEINPFAPPSGGSTYNGTAIVNSGPLFPGQSFSLTFTARGTFQYHCLFHDDTENMIATIVVV